MGLGYCVTLANDLSESNLQVPCDGLPVIEHERYQYGLCQAGTSVAVNDVGLHSVVYLKSSYQF
jgi:hypothetical protein